MNKVFRIIWNNTLGRLVVASEAAQSRGKSGGQRLQVAPTAAIKASPAGVLRPLVVAIGVAAGAVITPAMLASADSEVQAGKNIKVTESTGGTGQAVYSVATQDDVSFSDLEVTNEAILSALKVTEQATLKGGLAMSSQQITGLANGTAGDHAVNKSQLDSVEAKAKQGWNVKANSGSVQEIGPGETLTFADGDSNIQISRDGNTINVATSPNPNFTTVTTTGDVTVGGELKANGGLSVASGQSVDMGGNKVTNVADGTNNSDAVNFGQLDAVSDTASKGWNIQANGGGTETVAPGDTVEFTNGDNITITRNGKAITVAASLNPNFTTVTTTGDVTVGGELKANSGLSVASGQTVDMGGNAVTNVADGNVVENGNEAVSTGQLWNLTEGGDGIKYFHANSIGADSQANGTDSVAIGPTSVADGNSSFAAGFGATASSVAENGIALGTQASAGAGNSLAVGNQANAALESGTAIGNQAQAQAESSIAVGKQTLALGENATSIGATGDPITTLDLAVDGANLTSINGVPVTATGTPLNPDGTYTSSGSGQITEIAGVAVDEDGVNQFISALKAGANLASGTNSVSLGVGTTAAGDSSVAIGDSVNAAVDAVGIGKGARAAGSAVGIGPGATASGANSFAAGAEAQAGGAVSIALGKGAVAAATNNISIGEDAGVGTDPVIADDQVNNIAIGAQSGQNVVGQRNVAMGSSAGNAAEGNDNIAFGYNAGSNLTGNNNVSIGRNANKGADDVVNRAIAIGEDAQAGTDGIAMGQRSSAAGINGVALGLQSSTQGTGVGIGANTVADNNFVALGAGSQALERDVTKPSVITENPASTGAVSVGSSEPGNVITRRIVNVEDGANQTDAVNVGQLLTAIDEAEKFGGTIDYEELGKKVDGNFSEQIEENRTKYVSINDGGNQKGNWANEGATGTQSIAIGPDASTSGDNATAIGSEVLASGNSSVAIGDNIRALADNTTVIGNGPQCQDECRTL